MLQAVFVEMREALDGAFGVELHAVEIDGLILAVGHEQQGVLVDPAWQAVIAVTLGQRFEILAAQLMQPDIQCIGPAIVTPVPVVIGRAAGESHMAAVRGELGCRAEGVMQTGILTAFRCQLIGPLITVNIGFEHAGKRDDRLAVGIQPIGGVA